MRTSFGGVRKYGSVIGKMMMALVLAVLIGGISAVWAQHKDDDRRPSDHRQYEHRRPVYRPYAYPVYAPPPVIYGPPPPPPGITIFLPPIFIR